MEISAQRENQYVNLEKTNKQKTFLEMVLKCLAHFYRVYQDHEGPMDLQASQEQQ